MIRIIYQVFTDVWRLARKYEFRRLTDSEWEAFCGQGEELLEKYRLDAEHFVFELGLRVGEKF